MTTTVADGVRRLRIAAPLLALLVVGATAHGQTSSPPSGVSPGVRGEPANRLPHRLANGGADLPNGWRVTPAGEVVAEIGDMVANMTASPDGKVIVALNSGFQPHGLTLFDAKTHKTVQHIALNASFMGLAWSSDGRTLYVSGGNASGSRSKADPVSSIFAFRYANGRLGEQPVGRFSDTVDSKQVLWSGLAYLPSKHRLYAANLGTGPREAWVYGTVREAAVEPTEVVAFDTDTGRIVARIPVEVNPYQTVLSADGKRLFVSNLSSESVSVIDTGSNRVMATLRVGKNPNDMKLAADGRLFVACSNDNTVYVIDTRTLRVIERLSTTQTPLAPEGSTPVALTIDDKRKLLYVANADNNAVAVARIDNPAHSSIIGFIPTGWYPSSLALAEGGSSLFIANAKGGEGHATPNERKTRDDYVGAVQKGSMQVVPVGDLKARLGRWTEAVTRNTPYDDSLLSEARPPKAPSVIPQRVGEVSPIKHVIYIIKENRTYDQVYGDLKGANGDPDLAIFGEKVTPNQHALAREYAILDNIYCDGEVSVDGHSYSDGAYATDYNEKYWPLTYSGTSSISEYYPPAMVPSAGYIWDQAGKKGLTYRTYAEFGIRVGLGTAGDQKALTGHIAQDYPQDISRQHGEYDQRDTGKRLEVFLKEFHQYEANYDSADPNKRLPNLVVMSLPEDHTVGTKAGEFTPEAMVADNDWALGQIVEAVSRSRYWPETAIFVIEDDAQDGPDHVDARRTPALVISPYVKKGIVDSTLYTTSSMVRSMELLLGLPPMSQFDAAAMPMYAAFGTQPVHGAFTALKPQIDVNARNTGRAYGAKASARMDFAEVDRAPMSLLNEIVWKSVKGEASPMPAPVHRFRPVIEASGKDDD